MTNPNAAPPVQGPKPSEYASSRNPEIAEWREINEGYIRDAMDIYGLTRDQIHFPEELVTAPVNANDITKPVHEGLDKKDPLTNLVMQMDTACTKSRQQPIRNIVLTVEELGTQGRVTTIHCPVVVAVNPENKATGADMYALVKHSGRVLMYKVDILTGRGGSIVIDTMSRGIPAENQVRADVNGSAPLIKGFEEPRITPRRGVPAVRRLYGGPYQSQFNDYTPANKTNAKEYVGIGQFEEPEGVVIRNERGKIKIKARAGGLGNVQPQRLRDAEDIYSLIGTDESGPESLTSTEYRQGFISLEDYINDARDYYLVANGREMPMDEDVYDQLVEAYLNKIYKLREAYFYDGTLLVIPQDVNVVLATTVLNESIINRLRFRIAERLRNETSDDFRFGDLYELNMLLQADIDALRNSGLDVTDPTYIHIAQLVRTQQQRLQKGFEQRESIYAGSGVNVLERQRNEYQYNAEFDADGNVLPETVRPVLNSSGERIIVGQQPRPSNRPAQLPAGTRIPETMRGATNIQVERRQTPTTPPAQPAPQRRKPFKLTDPKTWFG